MSIISLNWNRLEVSRVSLKSLLENTTVPHELILIDNNSARPDLREFLSSIAGNESTVRVLRIFNSKNLGVAGGRNEGLCRASGEYLVSVDDDMVVPERWDELMIAACDHIPTLGITGVNVEPIEYPVVNINGVSVRPKLTGNLGGACLCLPRRVFNRVGYYQTYGQYGMEDCDMHSRLSVLGLMSAYIEPRGFHVDDDQHAIYREYKSRIQTPGSPQWKRFIENRAIYESTKSVFIPYKAYDPDRDGTPYERFGHDMLSQA